MGELAVELAADLIKVQLKTARNRADGNLNGKLKVLSLYNRLRDWKQYMEQSIHISVVNDAQQKNWC